MPDDPSGGGRLGGLGPVRRLGGGGGLQEEDEDEVGRLDAELRRARRPTVVTAPDQLRFGRWSVSTAAVVSLLALVVALGCAFVLRVLWAERTAGSGSVVAPGGAATAPLVAGGADGSPAPVSVSSAAGQSGSAEPAGPAATGPSATGAEIVVHVVGQVLRPGLVRLRQGARVSDAITAAGGARSGADTSALNLARLVLDGEQVHVPKPGEILVGGGTSGGSSPGGSSPGGAAAPVGLNTADVVTLDTLPGVGPVLAQRIVDWRGEHGRFTSVDELGEVSGIGDKLLAQLRPKVTL